jgi:hypothetical protein
MPTVVKKARVRRERAVLGLSPVRHSGRTDDAPTMVGTSAEEQERSSSMSKTCFPYSFPTGCAPSPRGSSRIWPRCTTAEPGSYDHEFSGTGGLY